MTVSNWEMQAGDPASFAFKLSFLRNPHGDTDKATPDEALSWGSFSLWVGGENLCAHLEQGDVLDASHWYMLPLMEWFIENWDAIFHEEQLPLRNVGYSAADSLAKTKNSPISLKEVDEFQWLDEWTSWWDRHNVRSRREGGLFPDLFLRRYRDSLEISTGSEKLIGIPEEFSFMAPYRRYEVDPRDAAESIFPVLKAGAMELLRRLPGSKRISQLVGELDSLTSEARKTSRMAWLAGLGQDPERYIEISALVDDALKNVDSAVREGISGSSRTTPLVVHGSAYAQLVYGAYSPSMTRDDVSALAHALVKNYVADASSWLNQLNLPLDAPEVKELTSGEQGSWLGERACELLAGDRTKSWIDVHAVLASLDIDVAHLALSDEAIRAVSVFGPTQRPKVFCNSATRWGSSESVERFTLAHELCHLILDRDHADELAVASGPWAPLFVEQRANAFAAAFLMPTWLLRESLSAIGGDIRDHETILALAAALHVSVSSVIDRLHNLGELDTEERFHLQARWRQNKRL